MQNNPGFRIYSYSSTGLVQKTVFNTTVKLQDHQLGYLCADIDIDTENIY